MECLYRTRYLLLLLLITLLLNSCFLKQDRTTVVYGTITDEKGQPVDSILVICQGVKGLSYETIHNQYSDSQGDYLITIEIPRRFSAVNVTVPFLSTTNPKFQRLFKGKRSKKNGVFTGNCCTAQIGDKTEYDFQLISK